MVDALAPAMEAARLKYNEVSGTCKHGPSELGEHHPAEHRMWGLIAEIDDAGGSGKVLAD